MGCSETIAQTHQDDIKKAKAGLYLKLVVGVKTTGISTGYNDRKKKIKESRAPTQWKEDLAVKIYGEG